ncbi:MAG: lipopolysaccharide biosynthesis protein RfbH [Erysipelotrichales bacterium]|nr:lipopolysaccharide biosynthesis protein RfbH [Erysipelotrichales bacterium]
MVINKEKEMIFKLVEEYYRKYHLSEKCFCEGDRISYSGRVFDEKEIINLVDSALDFWLTSGHYCKEFEEKLSEILNIKHCILVNSGSSANLIAFMALTSQTLGERQIKRGDEIITVAAGFPTTVTPIINYGAIPVFVDITITNYNIDVGFLEQALSAKTKAIMIAHTLGNPFDLQEVKNFCDKHKLWLIEDNCDALGAQYMIDGEYKYTGTIGDIGTSSFYPPHHLTMGEGGAVYTNNTLLNKIMISFRDWGRDCICNSGQDNLCKHRYDKIYGELPLGYDHKYVYSHFGYNLKATEMQAAIGLAQLDKLNDFINIRVNNFEYLYSLLSEFTQYFILPKATNNSKPSWFGFLITVKEGVNRNELVEYLEAHNIQTRMLFASNMILHPCFDEMRASGKGYRVVGILKNTNLVLNNTFWIGVAPNINKKMLDYVANVIRGYFNE